MGAISRSSAASATVMVLQATFAILDFAKNKLIVAPAAVTLDRDGAVGGRCRLIGIRRCFRS